MKPRDDEFIHVVKYTSDVKRSGKVFGASSDGDYDVSDAVAESKHVSLETLFEVVTSSILSSDHAKSV